MDLVPQDSGEGPRVYAHIEDSLALAEHLMPAEVDARLQCLGPDMRPAKLLLQACLLDEHALATPGTDGDDALFGQSRSNLLQIRGSDLPPRHKLRVAAEMLLAWEVPFRLRAETLPIPLTARRDLQRELAQLQLDFRGDKPLTSYEQGTLAELVAAAYLLNTDLFPYLALWREEANMLWDDNHDLYTLHPCGVNRIKKAPLSIKYGEMPPPNNKVVVLTVGRLAFRQARSTPPYDEDPDFKGPQRLAKALRLASDIIICHAQGEELSVEDKAFMWGLTARLQAPIVRFAESDTTPDYASNAEALRQEIAARRKRGWVNFLGM